MVEVLLVHGGNLPSWWMSWEAIGAKIVKGEMHCDDCGPDRIEIKVNGETFEVTPADQLDGDKFGDLVLDAVKHSKNQTNSSSNKFDALWFVPIGLLFLLIIFIVFKRK